jgi:hypothetical protein
VKEIQALFAAKTGLVATLHDFFLAKLIQNTDARHKWIGFDVPYPSRRDSVVRTSNPKLH